MVEKLLASLFCGMNISGATKMMVSSIAKNVQIMPLNFNFLISMSIFASMRLQARLTKTEIIPTVGPI